MLNRSRYKLLFYLAADQLRAYEWQHDRLTPGPRFGLDQMAEFGAWLARRPHGGAYLVADLVEEDFQRHLVPHVPGKAGRALVERKLGQLFRDTPYRYATVLGRQDGGRRDDDVLFCALTNAGAVLPWVQAMEQAKIALAGLYSLAALGGGLIATLELEAEHLLLVSRQAGGLRQSYFKNGSLKFSRLTPTAVDEHISGAQLAASVVAETEKTRQFLTSSRLMARGEQLSAVVLGSETELQALGELYEDGVELAYDPWELAEVVERMGVRIDTGAAAAPRLADQVLLATLLKRGAASRSHYPLGQAERFHQLWRARLGLYYASAATLGVATLWLLANLWASFVANSTAAALREEAARNEKRNNIAQAALPRSASRPANMQAAVSIAHLLTTQGPMPAPLLGKVSAALEQVPLVRLTRLDWQVQVPGEAARPLGGADAATATTTTAAGGNAAAPSSSRLLGVPAAPAQALRIEAEVMLPLDDDRGALQTMTRFAQELARDPHLQVAIEQPSLDVRPSVKLSGQAGAAGAGGAEASAKFILSLVWKP